MLHHRLLKIRNFHGLKQKDIANILGVSREAYTMYETNRAQMSYESLCRLADFYHISVDYLLGRETKDVFLCTEEEKEYIKKLRKVDERGKQVINAVLELEGRRMQKE